MKVLPRKPRGSAGSCGSYDDLEMESNPDGVEIQSSIYDSIDSSVRDGALAVGDSCSWCISYATSSSTLGVEGAALSARAPHKAGGETLSPLKQRLSSLAESDTATNAVSSEAGQYPRRASSPPADVANAIAVGVLPWPTDAEGVKAKGPTAAGISVAAGSTSAVPTRTADGHGGDQTGEPPAAVQEDVLVDI